MNEPVFICYKRENKSRQFVEEFMKKLNARGIEAWYDKRIKGGDTWQEKIDKAIQNCAVVVVVVTPASLTSPYVTYEWSYAMGKERHIIPALVEGDVSLLHPKLEKVQYRDFREQFQEQWDEIIDDIAEAIGKAKHSQASGGTPQPTLSNRDKAVIEEFLALFPRKRIQHLKTADHYARPSQLDETGTLKLEDIFAQLIEFSDRPHIKAMSDKSLQTLLIDAAKKLLRLQPKDWALPKRSDEDRPLNIIGGVSFSTYNVMKAAYDRLLTYILENHAGISVSP